MTLKGMLQLQKAERPFLALLLAYRKNGGTKKSPTMTELLDGVPPQKREAFAKQFCNIKFTEATRHSFLIATLEQGMGKRDNHERN